MQRKQFYIIPHKIYPVNNHGVHCRTPFQVSLGEFWFLVILPLNKMTSFSCRTQEHIKYHLRYD